ncbi:hypothetical protein [Christiangramia sabulilitoris]|uniref:Uncharacterized protein n=1 Tax=Christiangramia sabulilitoris TaxID=2583991 RepID=A0A550HZV3_9FLAO|nr:hypothetical protein [Christiangramia sabulilitoris]TRO64256.1 hypothetical protein FGM01_12220 [Christiangramia sabulilitoris]
MNKITLPEILDDVKSLISYSIANKDQDNSNFQMMHRAIIKKYFEAKHVNINYAEQTVDLKLPVGHKKYTSITFECQDLERFIKSCLKKDDKSIFFYQSLLNHYNVISAA